MTMQTFLPYPSYEQSAKALDNQRLQKQVVEGYQILLALSTGKGWIHHPATKMWRGAETALSAYCHAMVKEWEDRFGKFHSLSSHFSASEEKPAWFGLDVFHISHQLNLLRKDSVHYTFTAEIDPVQGKYVWPLDGKIYFSSPKFWFDTMSLQEYYTFCIKG